MREGKTLRKTIEIIMLLRLSVANIWVFFQRILKNGGISGLCWWSAVWCEGERS